MKSIVARILFASLILNYANAAHCDVETSTTCTFVFATEDAGKDAEIECVAGKACEVWCTAKAACSGEMHVHAEDATSLTVWCTAEDACKGSNVEIECPSGSSGYTCVLQCDGKDACSDAVVEGTFSCDASNSAVCPAGAVTTTATPTSPTVATTGAPTLEPTTAAPTVATSTSTSTTSTSTSTSTSTTTDGDDDDDDSSVSSESSDSSSDDAIIGAAAGLFEEDDENIDGLLDDDVDDGGVEHMVISLSDSAIGNLWGMAGLFILVNGMLCYCYHKKQKTQRAGFKPDPLP